MASTTVPRRPAARRAGSAPTPFCRRYPRRRVRSRKGPVAGAEVGTDAAEIGLSSGARARVRGPERAPTVVLVNGGVARDAPGTYSATTSWLAERAAQALPQLRFVEVRYRVRSWNRLEACTEDALAALDDLSTDSPTALLGFSMGGAVAVSIAAHPSVRAVIALSPWLPAQLDFAPLRGKRVGVYQGSLDAYLPGIPGISPAHSRAGWQRMLDTGVAADYKLVRGGMHGLALNAPWGGKIVLPKAHHIARAVTGDLERFAHGVV